MMVQTFVGSCIAFCLSLILQAMVCLPVNFTAGPIILLLYSANQGFYFCASLCAGLFLDCLSTSPRIGYIGLCMLIAARLIYPLRLYFFKDSISTLAIMTYLYVALVTMLQWLLSAILDTLPPFQSLRAFISEVTIMPFLDVIWASGAFIIIPTLTKRLFRTRRA